VVQLVEGEAGVEAVVEALVVDRLVDRLLDHQRGHRRQLGDAAGELEGLVLELGPGEDLRHHAEPVGLVDVDAVAGEHQLLGLAGAELPRVGEVLEAAHAEAGAHHVGEHHVVRADDEVAGPHEHEAGGVDGALHLGDGDLAEVAPAAGVLEVVVPLLEHPGLGPLAGGPVDLRGGVGAVLLPGLLRAHVVPGREERPGAAEDHDPAGVVGLRAHEGIVELDEQPAVLGVAGFGAVEEDPHDGAVVVGLVLQELVVGHRLPHTVRRCART
jgi:hypothetical protein